MNNRIQELQEKIFLTPGEKMELDLLLKKKYEPRPDVRKGGLQDEPTPSEIAWVKEMLGK